MRNHYARQVWFEGPYGIENPHPLVRVDGIEAFVENFNVIRSANTLKQI
jgi:hypothetical protein